MARRRIVEEPVSPEPEIEPSLDVDRVRATLRLCVDPGQADRLTALLQTDTVDPASLAPVMRAALVLFESARWRERTRRGVAARPILGPRRGLSGSAALALTFHLGLAMTCADLAMITGRTRERVGDDLTKARRVIAPQMAAPCQEFASLIGRQRDPVAERDEALSLMLHLGQCDRCRQALDRARDVDERVFKEFGAVRATLQPFATGRKRLDRLLLHPARFIAAAALFGALILIGVVAGARALRAAPQPAQPLMVAAAASDAGGGWLLESTDSGDVAALNVSTGAWRVLIAAPQSAVAQDLISPDQRRIARFTTSSDTGRPDRLQIFNLDGSVAHEWSLANPERVLIPLAWLNDTTMIVGYIPTSAFSTSFQLFTEQTDQQGSVVLFNVDSGSEQTIFNRGARSAVPSPDGRFIAISRYSIRLAGSVELRPFDGKTLGPAVGTFDDGGLPIFWSPDSMRVFFTQSHPLESTPVPPDLGDRGLSGQPADSYSIASMSLDGRTNSVIDFAAGEIANLAGLSPDGRHLIYVRGPSPSNGTDRAIWQSTIDGQDPVRIASATAGVHGESVVWSPSGDMFLTSAEPFYLFQAEGIPQSIGPSSYVTLMLDPSGRPVKALMDQLAGPALLGFASDLPDPAVSGSAGPADANFTAAQPVPGLSAHLSLTSGSRIGPGGDQLLVYDRVANLTDTLRLTGGSSLAPAGGGYDPASLPDGSGIIGVNQYTLQQGSRSRIAIYEPGFVSSDGPLEFDPANLGDASALSYRLPEMSPDGLRCSFFVVDDQKVSLWIAGRNDPATSVLSWQIPGNARFDVPLVSEWVSNDTLIVTVPEEWTGGYPLRATLERLRVPLNGQVQIDPLATWHVHGAEQGISIAEIAMSPDRTSLAARVRHFTGTDAIRDRFDSIDVHTTSNLASSLEVARGKAGDGLSWEPDGAELVAALDGQIVVTSATGSKMQRPPVGPSQASFPVWVRPNEIWFTSGTGDQATILRLVR